MKPEFNSVEFLGAMTVGAGMGMSSCGNITEAILFISAGLAMALIGTIKSDKWK